MNTRYVKINSPLKERDARYNFYLKNTSSNHDPGNDKDPRTPSSGREVGKTVNPCGRNRRQDVRSYSHPHNKNSGQDTANGRYPPDKNYVRNGVRNFGRNAGNSWDSRGMKNGRNLQKTFRLTPGRHNNKNTGTAATSWTPPLVNSYSQLDSPRKLFVDFRKGERCRRFLQEGICFKGHTCKKVHLLPKDDNIYCKIFEMGSCTRGDNCWFKHPRGDGFELLNIEKFGRKGNAQTRKEISRSSESEKSNITSLQVRKSAQDHKGLHNAMASKILAHHNESPSLSSGKAPKELLSKDKSQFFSKEDKVLEEQVIDRLSEPDIPSYMPMNATPDEPLMDLEDKQPTSRKTVSLLKKSKDIPGTEKQESLVQQRKGSSNLESGLASNLVESNFPDSQQDELLLLKRANKQMIHSPAVSPKMPRGLVEAREEKCADQRKRVVLQLQKTGSPNSKRYLVKRSSPLRKEVATSLQEASPQKPLQRKPSGIVPCEKNVDESSLRPANGNLQLKLRVSSTKDASAVEDSPRRTRNRDDFSSLNETIVEASGQTLSPVRNLSSRSEQLSNSCEEGKRHGEECRSLNSEAAASVMKFNSENHEQEGENEDLRSHHIGNEILENDNTSIKSSNTIYKSTSRKRRKSKDTDSFHQKCQRFKVVSYDLLRMTLIPTDGPTDVSDLDENVMKRNDYRKKQKKKKHSKERSQKRCVLKESNENSEVTFKDYKHTSKKSITTQTSLSDADVAAVGCDTGGGLLGDHRVNLSGGHHLTENVCPLLDYVDICMENSQKKRTHSTESGDGRSLNDANEIMEVSSTVKNCTPQNIITGHIYSSDTKDNLIETGSRLSEGREPDVEKEHERNGKLTQCETNEDVCNADVKIEEMVVLSSDEELETESVSRNCSYRAIPDQNDMIVVMERDDSAAENCRDAINHIMAAVNNPNTAADHIMKALDKIRAAAGHSRKLLNDPRAVSDHIKAAMDNPGAVQEHIGAAVNNLRAAVGQPMVAMEDLVPTPNHNSSLPAVSEDSKVCLDGHRTQYPTQSASVSENTITYSITLSDDVTCNTPPASRAENDIIESNNMSCISPPGPLCVETSFPSMYLPGIVNFKFDEAPSRVISLEAEKNLWDTFVKTEINDINEEDYVFDSEKEKEIVNYTAQWLDGLPEFVKDDDHLYENLKRAMKKMNLEVWEQDKRIVYNWEVNLRRLAVFTLGISDPDFFTENVREYMSEIPKLSDFVKYLTSLASTRT